MSPELVKLLQDTSSKMPKDLVLVEVSQSLYEQAFEFLVNKYGGAMGRTNLMLNGHLITPDLKSADAARWKLLEVKTNELEPK